MRTKYKLTANSQVFFIVTCDLYISPAGANLCKFNFRSAVVCITTSRKGASPDLLQCLDQERSL